MYTLVAVIIILLILIGLASLYSVFKSKIQFFINGLDAGFNLADLILLWNVAQICELEQPTALFYSLPALTKCMSQITNQAAAEGTDKSPRTQLILSKLFDYRTKIQNESDDKKGLQTSHSLDKGQKLRIILPGKGVFASELVNNGNMLVISIPKQKGLIPIPGEEWVGKTISVYLWRKGDARYVFDTVVTQQGLFLGKSSLYLKHSANLIRTQKRKAVRIKCEIYANLYFTKKDDKDDSQTIETKNGYRCLIEDISESGALIRIGGKGVANVKIKLQFPINNKLIIMLGIIRTVDFNEEEKQSLLHFECTHIDPIMRNEVLSFVYNMLPQNEKEVLEALEQTEEILLEEEGLKTDPNSPATTEENSAATSESPAEGIQVSENNTNTDKEEESNKKKESEAAFLEEVLDDNTNNIISFEEDIPEL
ncbi:MAG: PilZ domain-containing protein [Treponema sp.]|nr:PilZ domain-containing protein [Treponema sp.]